MMDNSASETLKRGGPDLPIALIAAALVLFFCSTYYDLLNSQSSLNKTIEQQKVALGTNQKAELQLDALASGLKVLADRGNSNAQRIVATLDQNGIKIHPPKGQ